MPDQTRHDSWQAGENYDRYMGRWSRELAPRFVDWLNPLPGFDWLDVGCGTGALTEALLGAAVPVSIVAVDPSEGFLALARARIADPRVDFREGSAEALPVETASCDAAVAALVLNFVTDRDAALAEMRRAVRPGGIVGFCVWDYPGGGMQFMRAFWTAATTLDPQAADLTEAQRFPFCTAQALTELATTAGLTDIACEAISIPTLFRDFDDLWQPFTLGTGPAPGYCASLPPEAREQLRLRLRESLPTAADGSIPLAARAWAVQGISP
ncbi:Class I SAM-dependent methyltransferase [Hyphomicrobiales bacterium]|nr:Class I SAM-dependent methyltransferase [Hyphomicrobiales bacterium]CAH1697705.1 Class I SAM-dependent methyltransferase [Hyphomicrobiales bacterium]CAI0347352.1 Class I SAM-dependent methyltransferase [Hyphomicrobiales bacterium]